jgi:hypothetical protein
MPKKKYKILEETERDLAHNGTVYRIQALGDFHLANGAKVCEGELGGWVTGEGNLSHEGCCWIADEAIASGNSWVTGTAYLHGECHVRAQAQVFGGIIGDSAVIQGCCKIGEGVEIEGTSEIIGNAVLSGRVEVTGHSNICDCATVYSSLVCGAASITIHNSWIGGYATIDEGVQLTNSRVSGYAHIFNRNAGTYELNNIVVAGDAVIGGNSDYFTAGPITIEFEYVRGRDSRLWEDVFVINLLVVPTDGQTPDNHTYICNDRATFYSTRQLDVIGITFHSEPDNMYLWSGLSCGFSVLGVDPNFQGTPAETFYDIYHTAVKILQCKFCGVQQ